MSKFHTKTKYNLPNCFVNISNSKEYTEEILNAIQTKKKTTFFYLNSYSFYLANKNHEFQKAFNKADNIIADGYSIVRMLKTLYKININKVVFTYAFYSDLQKIFSENKLRVYFLGASEKTITKSVRIIKTKYPALNIAGYSNGFSDFKTKDNNILRKINSAKPDILICGMMALNRIPNSESCIRYIISERWNIIYLFRCEKIFCFVPVVVIGCLSIQR